MRLPFATYVASFGLDRQQFGSRWRAMQESTSWLYRLGVCVKHFFRRRR